MIAPEVTIQDGNLDNMNRVARIIVAAGSIRSSNPPGVGPNLLFVDSAHNVRAVYMVEIKIPFIHHGNDVKHAIKRINKDHMLLWVGRDDEKAPKEVLIGTGVEYFINMRYLDEFQPKFTHLFC